MKPPAKPAPGAAPGVVPVGVPGVVPVGVPAGPPTPIPPAPVTVKPAPATAPIPPGTLAKPAPTRVRPAPNTRAKTTAKPTPKAGTQATPGAGAGGKRRRKRRATTVVKKPVKAPRKTGAGVRITAPSSSPASTGNLTVSERDLVIFRFLSRYRYATHAQIAQYVGTSHDSIRHRIPTLERAGLVTVHRTLTRLRLVAATQAAHTLAGITLPPAIPKFATLVHTLGLVDLGIFFEQAGEIVVTEREIRAAWAHGQVTEQMTVAARTAALTATTSEFGTADPRSGLYVVPPPPGMTGNRGIHIPDLVLARPPATDHTAQSVAIELELTPKDRFRLKKTLTDYHQRGRGHLGGVIYYTPLREIHTRVVSIAHDIGAVDYITARRFTPTSDVGHRP